LTRQRPCGVGPQNGLRPGAIFRTTSAFRFLEFSAWPAPQLLAWWATWPKRPERKCRKTIRLRNERSHATLLILGLHPGDPRNSTVRNQVVPTDVDTSNTATLAEQRSVRRSMQMPQKQTIQGARRAKRAGKAPTTQAGVFVREEVDQIRRGRHGARSPQQAIAIGLSKARRAGVDLPPRRRAKAKDRTRRSAQLAYGAGQYKRKPRRRPRVSRAISRALKREPRLTVSRKALSTQAKRAASHRSAAARSAAARKASRTKGASGRSAAAHKAARTRARR
jgi:hypothetical protein